MNVMRVQKGKYATFAAVMLATGSLALSPMIVPAFAAKASGPEQKTAPSWIAMFTPAGGDSVLAQKFSATQIAPDTRFPFTPASADEGRNRPKQQTEKAVFGADVVKTQARNALCVALCYGLFCSVRFYRDSSDTR